MTYLHALATTALSPLGIGTKILDALQCRLDGRRWHNGLILSQKLARQWGNIRVVKLSVGHAVLDTSSAGVALLGRHCQSLP